ncbi:MAG: OpgC domain-containing protein [Alphaproteobacteria bacterium]
MTTPSRPTARGHVAHAPVHALQGRDPRVDFFRGLAFVIILIAHIPANEVARIIPARWGLSDATEMFVFMSGYAAGIAFGGVYLKVSWTLGTARTLFRTWQVYVGHLLLFFFLAMLLAAANKLFDTRDYVGFLNLGYFFEHGTDAIVGLFTLHYVPNYFDILPMYIVILLLMPVFMGLGRIHPWLALGFCVALYAYNWVTAIGDLPGEIQPPAEVRPESDRRWFFNPFGWQLIFFTGFALAIGWLKPPRFSWPLMGVAIAYVLLCIPLGHWQWRNALIEDWPAFGSFWDLFYAKSVDDQPAFAKTNLWIARYAHFLALAYITVTVLHGREHKLKTGLGAMISQCGRQSLPVFLFGMVFSQLAGIMLDQINTNHWDIPTWQVVLVNLFWIGMLVGLAYLLGWLQKSPWKAVKRQPAPQHAPAHAAAPAPATPPERAPSPAE